MNNKHGQREGRQNETQLQCKRGSKKKEVDMQGKSGTRVRYGKRKGYNAAGERSSTGAHAEWHLAQTISGTLSCLQCFHCNTYHSNTPSYRHSSYRNWGRTQERTEAQYKFILSLKSTWALPLQLKACNTAGCEGCVRDLDPLLGTITEHDLTRSKTFHSVS